MDTTTPLHMYTPACILCMYAVTSFMAVRWVHRKPPQGRDWRGPTLLRFVTVCCISSYGCHLAFRFNPYQHLRPFRKAMPASHCSTSIQATTYIHRKVSLHLVERHSSYQDDVCMYARGSTVLAGIPSWTHGPRMN